MEACAPDGCRWRCRGPAKGAAWILFGRVSDAFRTLIHLVPDDFYGVDVPLLDLLTGSLFLLDLAVALARPRRKRSPLAR
jgi:hypothetical protein